MIEVNVNQIAGGSARSIGALRIDENDPSAAAEILQTFDSRTLAVLMKCFRDIAADYQRAFEEFGNPAG